MSTSTSMTAAQFWDMPRDGRRYELVSGELRRMSPSGWKHGETVGQLHGLLWQHVRGHKLGKIFGAETGFLIAQRPDSVRAPDIAFIARENIPANAPTRAFWPGPPDLAVQVLSPNDKMGEVDEKIQAWLTAGCRMVWIVDPQLKTVTVFRSATDIQTYAANQELDGGEVLPGYCCKVLEIFESP